MQRTFRQTTVSINDRGHVCISTPWITNWGVIYPHAIQDFKQGVINKVTGHLVQIIGMDFDVNPTHKNWIYNQIRAGHFDHLIP